MKKINLQEKLQSIGKSAFVLLFEYLKNNTDPEIIKKELRDYKWIDSTFASRYSSSKAIFDNGYEIDALRNIINSSKVKKQYRELASNILDNYIRSEEQTSELQSHSEI